ncbi:MAG: RNA polymerase sigma factor [Gemmatimonadetes bacterium]|nr:RNA polymerase sigma factor [Gemmatimonadota bacterium]
MDSPDAAPLPNPRDDERALIARAATGDARAARALYDAHATRVHRLAFRMCGDAELANDLVQDTFVRAFRQLGQFRGESSFGTWVHRVAVSVVLNAMGKVKRMRAREAPLDDTHDAHAPDDPHLRIDHDLRQKLHAAIAALPDGLRLALVMHAFEGYTHAEIGAALGIAEGTSKTRVFDARNQVRAALAAFVKD